MAMFLKNNFKKGDRIKSIPHDWLNTVANFYNFLEFLDGQVIRSPSGRTKIVPKSYDETSSVQAFSFQVIANSTTTIICMGGYCQYASSAEVSKNAVQFTVSASGSVYITLELSTGTFSAPTFGTLPSSDSDTKVYRIADVTFSSGAITSVVQRHFGDIEFQINLTGDQLKLFQRKQDSGGSAQYGLDWTRIHD